MLLKGHLKVCVTSAGCVMLAEARRTLAGESTDGVDAGELTVVSSALTFIHIYKSNHCFHSFTAEHLKDISAHHGLKRLTIMVSK